MDAVFLTSHPGWTWQDLQDAPAELIDTMRAISHAQAEVAKARENDGALR